MGEALSLGLRTFSSSGELYLYNPTLIKSQNLAKKVGGIVIESLEAMPTDCDWYILTFKPQSLVDFKYTFLANSKILSVLAGVDIETLNQKFPSTQIARLMPNTPSRISAGANLFYSKFDSSDLVKMLGTLGKVFVMESEEQLDKLTAVSGSGPALIFEFARSFYSFAESSGISSLEAKEIVYQTFFGSVKLMEEAMKNNISLDELRDQVTSKKGVTFEALESMKSNHFAKLMSDAFISAHKRTLELKEEIKNA